MNLSARGQCVNPASKISWLNHSRDTTFPLVSYTLRVAGSRNCNRSHVDHKRSLCRCSAQCARAISASPCSFLLTIENARASPLRGQKARVEGYQNIGFKSRAYYDGETICSSTAESSFTYSASASPARHYNYIIISALQLSSFPKEDKAKLISECQENPPPTIRERRRTRCSLFVLVSQTTSSSSSSCSKKWEMVFPNR